ncbi:MAG: hypothetical protein GY949_09140 [Gammaproteobacteria bacterium]|nr:hypothetical protein [Gammaproteobacteria bacterium]
MKLSNRELNLVAGIDHLQRQKIKGLIGVLIVLAVYLVLRYVDVLEAFDIPFDSLMLLYAAFHVGNTFSKISIEDRYVELLRRYVNDDADAISALSDRNQFPPSQSREQTQQRS